MLNLMQMGLFNLFLAPDAGAEAGTSVPSYPPIAGGETSTNEPAGATAEGQEAGTEQSPATASQAETKVVGTQQEGTQQDDAKKIFPWTNIMPDEFKNNEKLGGYKTFASFLKGENVFGDQANPAKEGGEGKEENLQIKPVEYKDFKQKISVSSDPNGTKTKTLLGTFQKYGVPQEEAEKLIGSFNETTQKDVKEFMSKAMSKCDETLQKDWGEKATANQNLAQRAYLSFKKVDASIEKDLATNGVLTMPAFWKALSILGGNIAEDSPNTNANAGQENFKGKRIMPNYPKIQN